MTTATATVETAPPTSPATLRTDTLAASVIIMLAMTVVQRLVGFVRSVLVCRWMAPEQLGEWDMALSFLTLAAPVAVFGIPGSFGRYLEHFRQREQLKAFLRRTTLTSVVLVVAVSLGLVVGASFFSQLIFGRTTGTNLVLLLAGCLLAAVAFNYFNELFTGLRLYRVSSSLQVVNSIAFALLCVVLLLGWQASAASMILSYAGSCLVAALVALFWLPRVWRTAPQAAAAVPQRDFWAKLMPFAMWVWATNWLSNLFEIADRYMLLHFAPLKAGAALELIGQYHSSRIVPLLLVAVCALFASLLTPHLSHDWETGRRANVERRLNLVLKLGGLALAAAGITIMAAAPLLFGVVFQDKYAEGQAVLPWTLTYCAWFAMLSLSYPYLWCAEKARLVSLALGAGLAANVALNLLLVPRFALFGAVWATVAANFLALMLIYWFSRLNGLRLHSGVWIVSALPLTFALGPIVAALVLAVVAWLIVSSNLVLTAEEKRQLIGYAADSLRRLRQSREATGPVS